MCQFQSLYNLLEGIGKRPSGDPERRAKDIFETIDTNHDGTLSEEEFREGDNFLSICRSITKIGTNTRACLQPTVSGCMTDDELMSLLNVLFDYLLEARVNLHAIITHLKFKYMQ